jgi:superfamily II DNA/RNA helicase
MLDVPSNREEFVHRIGRVGRTDTLGTGFVLILCNQADRANLYDLEMYNGFVPEEYTEQAIFGGVTTSGDWVPVDYAAPSIAAAAEK